MNKSYNCKVTLATKKLGKQFISGDNFSGGGGNFPGSNFPDGSFPDPDCLCIVIIWHLAL